MRFAGIAFELVSVYIFIIRGGDAFSERRVKHLRRPAGQDDLHEINEAHRTAVSSLGDGGWSPSAAWFWQQPGAAAALVVQGVETATGEPSPFSVVASAVADPASSLIPQVAEVPEGVAVSAVPFEEPDVEAPQAEEPAAAFLPAGGEPSATAEAREAGAVVTDVEPVPVAVPALVMDTARAEDLNGANVAIPSVTAERPTVESLPPYVPSFALAGNEEPARLAEQSAPGETVSTVVQPAAALVPAPPVDAGQGEMQAGATQAIPREVYATVPDFLGQEEVDQLKQNLAFFAGVDEAHLHLYNDEGMAESACRISHELESLGFANFFEAFAELRPGAFKADLWRYMALWDHGGVYVDMDLRLNTTLEEWIDFSDPRLVVVSDRPPNAIWQAMMAAPPRHPGLLAIMQSIAWHVRERFYGDGPLDLTGPTAFFSALESVPDISSKIKLELKMVTDDEDDRCGGYPKPSCQPRVVKISDPDSLIAYKDVQAASTVHGPLHYSNLFSLHQIYCSEPGPPCPELFVCG